jgi:hypothetical protein
VNRIIAVVALVATGAWAQGVRDFLDAAEKQNVDRKISIDAMVQKEPAAGESEADIILLTHRTIERNMDAAIASIEALATVSGRVTRLRLEEL